MTFESRTHSGLLVLPLIALLLGGCDKTIAMGDPNEILVASNQATYDALEEEIRAAMEPTVFTVRDERVFDIGHIDPSEANWPNARIQRQVLAIGSRSDPTVAEALREYSGDIPQPPSVFQVRNVWAQNQVVTVLLTDDDGNPASVRPLIPQLGETFLAQFENYSRSRMFVSGTDEALAQALRDSAGFSITLPEVYRKDFAENGVYVFRNDRSFRGSAPIRSITIASKPRGEVPLNSEAAVAWRAELAAELTQPPQVTEGAETFQSMQVGSRAGLQVQGIWSNPPGEWPSAGPFLVRLIDCPERTFLVDAWLYAPGQSKYEYMFQFKTILDSFECA